MSAPRVIRHQAAWRRRVFDGIDQVHIDLWRTAKGEPREKCPTQHAKSDFTKENARRNRGFRQLLLELQTDGEGVTKKRNYRPTYREITGKNLMDFEFASADGPPG